MQILKFKLYKDNVNLRETLAIKIKKILMLSKLLINSKIKFQIHILEKLISKTIIFLINKEMKIAILICLFHNHHQFLKNKIFQNLTDMKNKTNSNLKIQALKIKIKYITIN